MSYLKSAKPTRTNLLVVGVFFMLQLGFVSAQTPAQKPLTNRDGGGVSPNLVLTLDTSRSMDFQHVPETNFVIATSSSSSDDKTVTSTGSKYVWMHPFDPGPGYYDGTFRGIVPSNPYRGTNTDKMLLQMQLRSPDLNAIYYNPERRYDPWIKADGTRMPASPPTAAPYIPMMPALARSDGRSVTANLTTSPIAVAATSTVAGLNTGKSTSATRISKILWCEKLSQVTAANAGGMTYGGSCSDASAESYYPMVYYRLDKGASGYFKDPNNFQNYTFYDINGMKKGSTKSNSTNAGWGTLVTLTSFPKAIARTDCVTTAGVCTQDEERQNFANWFTYYRSRMLLAQGAIPEAFKDVEDDKIRLGWGTIHKAASTIDGASSAIVMSGVRDFGGTSSSSIRGKFISWMRNHPGNTDSANGSDFETVGGTPLIASVIGVGEYYKRSDNGGPWSDDPASSSANAHKTCRRAYNMLVTDGYYGDTTTAVGNFDNTAASEITGPSQSYTYAPAAPYKDSTSNTLADVAMKYWGTDLRGIDNGVVTNSDDPAFWQHMTNYMVGLGVNGTLDQVKDWPGIKAGTTPWPAPSSSAAAKVDDLWHAAINSRGAYFSAKDPKSLTEGIKEALGQALKRELKESGVATASATLQDGNRKYVPFYKTGDWNGDIQAFILDANGQAGASQWTAEAKVPVFSSRNIWTWNTDTTTPSAVSFTWADMGTTNQTQLTVSGTVGTNYSVSGVNYNTLVDFLRGDRSKEGDTFPFRERKGVLGDFVNSNPVLVKDSLNMGYTTLATGGSLYTQFLADKKARTAVLFVGGNDGMLHAFRDTLGAVPANDGTEIFAYVPKAVMPNLSKLSDKYYGTTSLFHQFYVDGPLVEADAYINAPGASTPSWRNYLLGSLGAGGRAVFALDVTNSPNLNVSSTVRWELSSSANSDLGYVMSPIQVGVLPNGEWVAIFGNGVGSDAGKATLFVVNLQTGAAQTLDVETTTGTNGLGGVGLVRNTTGQITGLYAGDLKGNLWKFDYSATASSRFVVSGGAALFVATDALGNTQPITQPPLIYDHSKGGKLVTFGTGRLITEADANSIDRQAIYGVWDKGVDSVTRPMGRTNMVTRTLSTVTGSGGATFYSLVGNAVDWTSSTERGWTITLDPVDGMRVVYPPQVVSKTLALFSVVSPARSLVPCEGAKGSGANLLFPVETGKNPTYPIFNTNGDTAINSSDSIVAGYATNADGIDAIVRGTADCSTGTCKTKISIQNTTGQIGGVIEEPGGTLTMKDRVWRRIINPPIR